jgi:hypothetical protein
MAKILTEEVFSLHMGHASRAGFLSHLWSLAMQEQF